MKINLHQLMELRTKAISEGGCRIKLVGEMLDDEGRNIYKNILGHQIERNYILYDLSKKSTGLERHIISLTEISPGKVNGEGKMTTGHTHPQEEVYIFLGGKGELILRNQKGKLLLDQYERQVSEGDLVTIPSNVWHRVFNTGDEPLEFLCIFENYERK